MSDSDQSKKTQGVPSWQLKPTLPVATDSASTTPESSSREAVIAQAKKFLDEDEVRNASTDKKIAFLESKGLQSDEIQELLGISRNPDATSTSKEINETQETVTPQSSPPQSILTPQPTRDAPPIITYPEFLTTTPGPAPLITTSRVLATLYLFSGLSALLYGASNYVVAPMLASLTESRHSLAETAAANVLKLIAKLESAVSEIPPTLTSSGGNRKGENSAEIDDDSDSDPSEMFHRDIGVQTSQPPTPSSRPSSPSLSKSIVSDQTTRLDSLTSSIKSVVEASTSEGNDVTDLSTTLSILREYLDGLAFVAPTYAYGSGMYGAGIGSGDAAKDGDDEISKVKASIRGVKGVLLSAKSFPGGMSKAR